MKTCIGALAQAIFPGLKDGFFKFPNSWPEIFGIKKTQKNALLGDNDGEIMYFFIKKKNIYKEPPRSGGEICPFRVITCKLLCFCAEDFGFCAEECGFYLFRACARSLTPKNVAKILQQYCHSTTTILTTVVPQYYSSITTLSLQYYHSNTTVIFQYYNSITTVLPQDSYINAHSTTTVLPQ